LKGAFEEGRARAAPVHRHDVAQRRDDSLSLPFRQLCRLMLKNARVCMDAARIENLYDDPIT
jgi:hypothetical protein